MAIANTVGKDRRGKPIFKRDKEGREMVSPELYPQFRDSSVIDFHPFVEPSGRILDDDLPAIAHLYREASNGSK
jgi:hypothetical protein